MSLRAVPSTARGVSLPGLMYKRVQTTLREGGVGRSSLGQRRAVGLGHAEVADLGSTAAPAMTVKRMFEGFSAWMTPFGARC